MLQTGVGFESHPHRDLEIVTWVLSGALSHEDSTGHRGLVRPGMVQRLSAGRGVVHSEWNDGPEPVRFVQSWLTPPAPGAAPAYELAVVEDALLAGGLVPVMAYGRGVVLHAARLQPGESVRMPEAPFVHVFLSRGTAVADGAVALRFSDAMRLTGEGGGCVVATEPTELLVWELPEEV